MGQQPNFTLYHGIAAKCLGFELALALDKLDNQPPPSEGDSHRIERLLSQLFIL